jgi:environmental stress-induced protein Ves
VKVLRSRDYLRTPWKNGGGETLQVAIWPPGATIDRFDWRISLSAVTSDGPFSTFPGVDRTLCLTGGTRIDLTVDGVSTAVIGPLGALRFAGDAHCFAHLPDGPISDLNVMSRRSAFDHSVRAVERGARIEGAPGLQCCFIAVGECAADCDTQRVTLAHLDALILGEGETADLFDGAGWLATLWPLPSLG